MNELTHPATILLVEDNDDDVVFLRRSLMKAGIANPLVVVKDGVQALDYLHRRGEFAPPAQVSEVGLVVTDLNMPRVNGWELLARLRQEQGAHHVPVIVLSGSDDQATARALRENGAAAVVEKPVGPRALLELLHRIEWPWLSLTPSP
jgi:two-component system response regulator